MSEAYKVALRSLAAIRLRLAGELTEAERAATLVEFDRVLQALNRGDHRASTLGMARRVQALDSQLQDRDPAERNSIVMQRLGIGRTRLYELRAVRLSPDGGAV